MVRFPSFSRPPSPTLHALALAVACGLSSPALAAGDDYRDGLDAERRAEFDSSRGLAVVHADDAYARGLDGRGIVVGVFDSGVHPQTPDLAGRVSGLVNGALAPDGTPCPDSARLRGPNPCIRTDGARPQVNYIEWDAALFAEQVPGADGQWLRDNIMGGRYAAHGTHVAGIVAAARDGLGMHGVAPAASLVAARLDSDAYRNLASFFDLPGGVVLAEEVSREAFTESFSAARQAGARVINHSWGFVAESPRDAAEADAQYAAFADKLETLADASRRSGVLQVFAAGNTMGGVATTPADLPNYVPDITPYWVSVVSASDDGSLDFFSATCGATRDWCVAAPGYEITSTVLGGQVQAAPTRDASGAIIGLAVAPQQPTPEFEYVEMTGTSQAAPHVSGALALLMQRFPYLDNPQVRDVLLTTARDLGEPGVDEIFGWGMLDLRRAIDGPGQLRVDTQVEMDQRGGGVAVWAAPAWDEWRNPIDGPGRLLKAGPGWLRLTGDNRFGGATVSGGTLEFSGDNALRGDVVVAPQGTLRVSGRLQGSDVHVRGGEGWIDGEVAAARVEVTQGGRLEVDGRITGPVEVGTGSRLQGNGELGPTTLAGSLAPGHSIGRLRVTGDFLQLPGSVYEAELGASGQSDLLQVNGRARLQGGALWLGDPGIDTTLGQQWRVLQATQGVEGGFSALTGYTPATPFLAMTARYSGDAVDVVVGRGAALASAARTRNQREVAAAVDAGADLHPLTQRLTRLMPAQLPAALAPLDGELHASLRTLLLQDSESVRDTALARARGDTLATTGGRDAWWVDVRQRERRLPGDGNAGAARLDGGTWLAGYDHRFEDGWTLGALGGSGEATARWQARPDRADVHALHLGLQAGRRWQAWAWRVGAAYSWQDVRSRREGPAMAGAAGVSSSSARYDVDTLQWFTELGYRIGGRRGEVEPFLQYAGVRLRGDAAQEHGGAVPLSIARATQDVGLWRGGVRAGVDVASRGQREHWLGLRGELAYQQADGDLTPAARLHWQDGAAFTTWGAPLARQAVSASLGVSARLSANSLLALDWRGIFADNAHDTVIGARYSLRF